MKSITNLTNSEVEFVAFSRLLLRNLEQIKALLLDGDSTNAIKILNELIQDTKCDISEAQNDELL